MFTYTTITARFDEYSLQVIIDGKPIILGLWDTTRMLLYVAVEETGVGCHNNNRFIFTDSKNVHMKCSSRGSNIVSQKHKMAICMCSAKLQS